MTRNGHRLTGSAAPISMKSPSLIECHYSCIKYPKCKALAFNVKKSLCELYDSDLSDSKTELIKDSDWDYKESEKDPLNLGPVCNEKTPCNTEWGRCRDICGGPGYRCICKVTGNEWKVRSDCTLNIAYKKPAESGGNTQSEAASAVDGSLGTGVYIYPAQWLIIDFEEVYVINQVKLYGLSIADNSEGMRVIMSESGTFSNNNEVQCALITGDWSAQNSFFACDNGAPNARKMKLSCDITCYVLEVSMFGQKK